jgi:hypothetical protein
VPIVGTSAGELVAQTESELAEVAEAIRSHRFLELLRSRDVPRERLAGLAGAQHMIVSSDRRSFAVLAARFPGRLAGEFFLSLAGGEGVALRRLWGLSEWLGMTDAEVIGYEPDPGTQAYPAFVAWHDGLGQPLSQTSPTVAMASVPVPRWSSRSAVHRLRRAQTPAAPGDPQQGQRVLLDRVLPRPFRGHSMSGKTRMAYEVVRARYGDWPV